MLDPDQLQYVHRVWQVPSEVDSATQPPNWEMFVDGLAEHGSAYDSTNRLHLQGQNRFIYLNSMAVAQNTSDATVSTGVVTTLTFDSDLIDTDSIHNTASNTSRLTAQIAGKYIVVGGIAANLPAAATAFFAGTLKNGTTDISRARFSAAAGGDREVTVAGIISLAVSDYVELTFFHNAGSDATVYGTSGAQPTNGKCTFLAMAYIGE